MYAAEILIYWLIAYWPLLQIFKVNNYSIFNAMYVLKYSKKNTACSSSGIPHSNFFLGFQAFSSFPAFSQQTPAFFRDLYNTL